MYYLQENDKCGWLTPSGRFIPSPWGHHEESAEEIVFENDWEEDYRRWREPGEDHILMRDYLVMSRGFVLFHNPMLGDAYVATYAEKLTRKQRDRLYDLFLSVGDRDSANALYNSWNPNEYGGIG